MSQPPQDGPHAPPPWTPDGVPRPTPHQSPASGPTTPGAPMPAHGSGTYPYAATAEHSGATMAFVLGLISVLMMPILGPVAWYLSRKAVREIDADSGTTYRNRGLAVAGMVLGIVGTVICALIVLVLIGIFVFVVILAAAAPS